MLLYLQRKKAGAPFKAIIGCIILSFLVSIVAGNLARNSSKSYAAYLPAPTQLIPLSANFNPPVLRGITIHPEDPFVFDFIIDSGDKNMSQDELRQASKKLIRHFLASLTIPEEDLWVNLSPYEADKIAPGELGITEMGRDMLAQDYILKQLLSSVTYPESPMGKQFWSKVYEKAYQIYGTTNIPINTFNKIWIVPEKALIYENGASAYVLESRLKVMLEEDYVALSNNLSNTDIGTDTVNADEAKQLNDISSSVMKEIILPEIEKEINEGKNFAPLRQIYNSLVLAVWFKNKLRNSIINQIYTDKRKVKGVDLSDKEIKEKIYNRYLEAYKQGVYDYVKTEYDANSHTNISRRYYSGGLDFAKVSSRTEVLTSPPVGGIPQGQTTASVTVRTTPADGGGSGVGTASGIGTGSGGGSATLESVEYKEQLRNQLEQLLEGLKRARVDRRLIKALRRSLSILESIESGAFAKYGYNQIADVLFHGYSHAVNNTNQAIETLKNAIASVSVRLGVDISSDAVVVVAIAAMYHDVGYYREDSHGFGTIKVDHEQRSKEFVRTFAKKLGINPSFVPLICLVISSTQANVKEGFWKELQTAVEALLQDQNNIQAAQRLEELLVQAKDANHAGSSLGILEDRSGNLALNQKDLSLFLGIILGAKALASLDIYDTRENAIEVIEGLRLEFARDKQRLLNWLAQNSNFSEDDIGTFQSLSDKSPNSLILTAESLRILDSTHTETEKQLFAKAMDELFKIHAADTHAQQVSGTKVFLEYADGRVNDLGIWGFVGEDARREFEVKRRIIYKLAEEGKIGELSQGDIARLRQQVEEEAALSQEVLAKRAEEALAAEGLRHHTPLTPERLAAIERAHQVGEGHAYEIGPDGRPVKHSNPNEAYTAQEIAKKARILREAGFTIEEIDVLIRYGVVGNESTAVAAAGKAFEQTYQISSEMEQAVTEDFNAALAQARGELRDFSDLYDQVSLFIGGSVVRAEAVRATDVDYAIIFIRDGEVIKDDSRVAEAREFLRLEFERRAKQRGFRLDHMLEVVIQSKVISRAKSLSAHCLLLDTKLIAGNANGDQFLHNARSELDQEKVLAELEVELKKFMSSGYKRGSVKGHKRELDLLLFLLRSRHGVDTSVTPLAVTELINKSALTHKQGERIVTQINEMLRLRLLLDSLIEQQRGSETVMKRLSDEAAPLADFEGYLSQQQGMSLEAFRQYYTFLINENRSLIREIMGESKDIASQTPPTITEEVSQVMEDIPNDIRSFVMDAFMQDALSLQEVALHVQIALVLIGAKPAYFADHYNEIPFSSQERIDQLCREYGINRTHTGQGAIIYRQEAVQGIIDADPEFYNGLASIHRGGDVEIILKEAAKNGNMAKFGGELLGFGNQKSLDPSLGLLSVKINRIPVLSCRVAQDQAERLGRFYKDALERILGQRMSVRATYALSFAQKAQKAFLDAGLINHTPLTQERVAAIQRAHQVGEGHAYEIGKDGKPQKHSNPDQAYTSAEIAQKARILQEAGFTRQEIDALIRHGVAGSASASAEGTNSINSRSNLSSFEASMLLRNLREKEALTYEQVDRFIAELDQARDTDGILEIVGRALESIEQDSSRPQIVLVNGDICERMSHGGEAVIFKNMLMFSEGDSKYVVRLYRSSEVTREHLELYVWVLEQLMNNGVPMPSAEVVSVNIPGENSQTTFGVKVGYVEGEAARTAQYKYSEVPGEVSKMVEKINKITRKLTASSANTYDFMGGRMSAGLADFGGNVIDAEAHYDNYIWSPRKGPNGVTERHLVPVDPIHINDIIKNQDRIKQAKQSSKPTHAAGNVGSSHKKGNPGGIDFNPHHLNIETRGSIDVSTLDVPFDVQYFEGFTFNIISVETIDDLTVSASGDREFRNLSYLP